MTVSDENKTIAKAALAVFGGKPAVHAYWDDNNENYVDIMSCCDRPYDGVTSYSTIGLSGYSIDQTVDDIPLRVEIVGACASSYNFFPNILGTCAFNIINSKYTCYPGAIFHNVIKYYMPDCSMKHIMFISPFLWENKLTILDFADKKVAWLLALPISEKEFEFAQRNSTDDLETIFEEHQIDIFDLNRKSVK